MILYLDENDTMAALLMKKIELHASIQSRITKVVSGIIILLSTMSTLYFGHKTFCLNPDRLELIYFYISLVVPLLYLSKTILSLNSKYDSFHSYCITKNLIFFTLQLAVLQILSINVVASIYRGNTVEEMLLKLFLAATTFLFVIALMVCILCVLDYNVYRNFLRNRITDCEYILDIIRVIARKFPYDSSEKIKDWSKRIFNEIVSGEKPEIIKSNQADIESPEVKTNLSIHNDELELDYMSLAKYMNNEEIEDFLSVLDIDVDGSLTQSEFVHGILYIYRDKIALSQSIRNHNQMYNKLIIIFMMIFVPFAIFLSSLTLQKGDLFSKTIGPIAGFFVPMTFVFGSSLSEIFQSIFFIFCIRPFDISDYIIFEKQVYVVKNMYLSYTELFKDGKIKMVTNQTLKTSQITNLRFSNELYEKVIVKVNREANISKMLSKLRNSIKEFTEKHSKLYNDMILFENFVYTARTVQFEICFIVNIGYTGMQSVKERRDKMARYIDDCLPALGFKMMD